MKEKNTGIIRKVDELGRIVIPIEIRNGFDIAERDPLEIFVDNNSIILKKYEISCVFCNKKENLIKYKDKYICKKCISNIDKL